MSIQDPDWSRLVQELGPRLYRYFCGSFTAAQASDLVQDTLIRLVQKHRSGEFEPQQGTFAAYAFGIARYVRLEALKGTKVFETSGAENEQPSQSTLAHDPDPVAHLRWAIGKLSLVEQEILLRMIDEECHLDTIAQDLGMPLGTVKSHVHRAKEKIRNLMEVRP